MKQKLEALKAVIELTHDQIGLNIVEELIEECDKKVVVDNFQPRLADAELTFGEKAVGVSFNPSKMPEVDSIKANFAQLIDLMEDNKFNTRLGAMLKTEAQMNCVRAAMSIVKLLTFTE